MRRPRIKAEGAGYYHCMSRVIERRYIFHPKEKERFRVLMRNLAGFSGLEILTYALLDNHFHILVRVPERRELSDEELVSRLRWLYAPEEVELIAGQLQDFRKRGQDQDAEALKARYTYRMYDISEFFKALKQQFSQNYNVRAGRSGPLWEQRFKSILVEGSEKALSTIAAYIDLNPVRAGIVTDPQDYRYSGYGEAMGGGKSAREGLRRLFEITGGHRVSWGRARAAYRQQLYVQGQQRGQNPQGQPIRPGFTPEQVKEVLAGGGRLPLRELLRCRVRYFSDGVALGTTAFVEDIFRRYRGHFGARRKCGARLMRYADWGELRTLRDLRREVVCRC
jgi:putative transposase